MMQFHLLFVSEIGEKTEKHKKPQNAKAPGRLKREWLVEDVFGIGVFSTLVYQTFRVHFVTCEFDSIPVL